VRCLSSFLRFLLLFVGQNALANVVGEPDPQVGGRLNVGMRLAVVVQPMTSGLALILGIDIGNTALRCGKGDCFSVPQGDKIKQFFLS